MMTISITFVSLGETAMAHGSSTKMEHCTSITKVCRKVTLLREEARSYWGKTKIHLDQASNRNRPFKEP